MAGTLTDPPLVRGYNPTRYYQIGEWTSEGGQSIVRPETDLRTDWRREDDQLVLGDEGGAVFERFSDVETALSPTAADLETCRCRSPGEEWMAVQPPFVTGVHIDDGVSRADWSILIVPNDDRDREPAVYRAGEAIALSALLDHDGTSGESAEVEALIDELERV